MRPPEPTSISGYSPVQSLPVPELVAERSLAASVVDLQPLPEHAPVDGLRHRLARGEVLLLGLRREQRLGRDVRQVQRARVLLEQRRHVVQDARIAGQRLAQPRDLLGLDRAARRRSRRSGSRRWCGGRRPMKTRGG
ncbi:hypothetical protein WMF18_40210 [Sorangium sp. So ce315]|uniref:hypothetical protein n=1 Tax=Sorangium sp. So ce315 TaxID=3133299 RepID=UPI003F63E5A1